MYNMYTQNTYIYNWHMHTYTQRCTTHSKTHRVSRICRKTSVMLPGGVGDILGTVLIHKTHTCIHI